MTGNASPAPQSRRRVEDEERRVVKISSCLLQPLDSAMKMPPTTIIFFEGKQLQNKTAKESVAMQQHNL
jgi:hypothetical protein